MSKKIIEIFRSTNMERVRLKIFKRQRLIIALILILFSLEGSGQIENDITKCVRIDNPEQRLQCYDELAIVVLNSPQAGGYIQPPKRFLDSELRVDARKSDFSLTVTGFLNLLKTAKMDNNRLIQIKGWQQWDRGYTLLIKMKSSVQLKFAYVKHSNQKFCVLQPVLINGNQLDPTIYIMNIAAMTPD